MGWREVRGTGPGGRNGIWFSQSSSILLLSWENLCLDSGLSCTRFSSCCQQCPGAGSEPCGRWSWVVNALVCFPMTVNSSVGPNLPWFLKLWVPDSSFRRKGGLHPERSGPFMSIHLGTQTIKTAHWDTCKITRDLWIYQCSSCSVRVSPSLKEKSQDKPCRYL